MPRRLTLAGTGAALLAVFVLVVAVHYGTFAAGGSDSYGYVSQAKLWMKGRLQVRQPLAALVPWPGAIETLCPLGYTTVGPDTIVPTYAPGLSMLMALLGRVFGDNGPFYVVPLAGVLVVWSTYLLGRRLTGRSSVGAAAAAVVAATPAFLYMVVQPMSDVPAAALWTLSLVLALSSSPACALLSGLAAGVAVLVRPNLVPAALVIAASIAWRAYREERRWFRRSLAPMLFACGVAPGLGTVAFINASLHGSPLSSGYGSLRELYSWAFVLPNLRNYITWLALNGGGAVLAGMVALVAWPRTLTANPRGATRFLLTGLALVFWASYVFYLPFDFWWYLRFLLPVFPLATVLATALVADLLDTLAVPRPRMVLIALATILFVTGLAMARHRNVFGLRQAEARYPAAGAWVKQHTPARSVVFAMQHSGSVMLYGSRQTVRYDLLDPAWLDRAVSALVAMRMHPYFLLEGWEVAEFKKRFQSNNRLGSLGWPPEEAYPGVFVWDPAPAWTIESETPRSPGQ